MQRNKKAWSKQEKKQTTETVQIELSRQRLKSAILSTFKELKETISKELKESMRTMSHQIENIHFLKKNQIKLWS